MNKSSTSGPVLTHGRRSWMVLAVAALVAGGAGCGSDDDAPAGSVAARSTQADAGSEVVGAAKKIVAASDGKLVFAASERPVRASDIEPYGSWRGPAEAPQPKPGLDVQVIVCTKQAPACVDGAKGVQEAGKALGWTVEVIDGGGTPQGFSGAFDTAFSRDPDAIVGLAVPTAAVADKLKAAKDRGIVTVAAGDVPVGSERYDAYVPFPMSAQAAVMAWSEIARTDGKAKTVLIEDRGFPNEVEAVATYEEVMAQCSGCETSKVTWQVTDSGNPTKVAALVRGALNEQPDATAVYVPYGLGLPAVTQAVAASGKAESVRIISKGADGVSLPSVVEGDSLSTAGSSLAWAGWAAMDQVVRGTADAEYLEGTKSGLGTALFTKETAPASGAFDDLDGLLDFKAKYRELWGR